MLEIEKAEEIIDDLLSKRASIIIQVDPMEQTAIGSCESPMNLYVFDIHEGTDEVSIVIADSQGHGIKVFFLKNLHADNLLPENAEYDTSEMLTPKNLQFHFELGSVGDFINAIRVVNSCYLMVS